MFYFITHKPIDDITNTVSSEFGKRVKPNPDASDQHKGIDFSVSAGTQVYAAHKGVVRRKDPNDSSGGGKVIFLETQDDSGNKYSTRYLHLSEFGKIVDKDTGELREIIEGDEIEGGKPITLSGDTGSASSGAHLHFTVIAKGEKQNPREYLAAAFPNEFATTVKSGTYGIDLTGDLRDNTLIGNSRSNVAKGLAGTDTYYFPTLAGSDVIDDVDLDGKIVIGNGKQSVSLSGNALPKTDADGKAVDGVWTLSGFDLHKIGSDLVIVKAAADVAKDGVGKATVKDFPFENSRGSFGITLGKKIDLNLERDVFSKSVVEGYLTNGGVALASSEKKFFSTLSYTDSYGNTLPIADSIALFDEEATRLSSHSLDDAFQSGVDVDLLIPKVDRLRCFWQVSYTFDGKKYFAQSVSESGYLNNILYMRAGALLLDQDGNILSTQIYVNTNDRQSLRTAYAGGFFTAKDDPNDLYYSYRGESGGGDLGMFLQKVDPTNLAKIGTPLSWSSYSWNSYGNALYQGVTGSISNQFTLESGTTITISSDGKTITSAIPKLRDFLPHEITPNQDLTAGSQSTDPSLKKSIVAFQPDVSASLEISPNPNSCLAVIGCDSNPAAKMSFPVDHHSQISLYSSTDCDYTLDQLLNGEFDFGAAKPLPISRPVNRRKLPTAEEARILADPNRYDKALVDAIWERGLGGKEAAEALVKESERSLALENFTNSTDDDYSYGYYGDGADDDSVSEPEIDLENLQSPYTIILLPNNQTVILVGVNATEVAKTPEVYFLAQGQLTNSPSGQPSGEPSSEPTGKPSNQPTENPTSHPTAGDLIMPTGCPSQQPSLKPFANPSAAPSYKPQEIPSFNPTGKPSSLPTGEPSITPSKQNKQPTNQPSRSQDDSDIPSASQTEFSTSYPPTNLRASFEPTVALSISPTTKNTIESGDDSKPSNITAPVTGGVAALLTILGLGAVYKYCKGAKGNKMIHPKSEREGFAEIVGKNDDENGWVRR